MPMIKQTFFSEINFTRRCCRQVVVRVPPTTFTSPIFYGSPSHNSFETLNYHTSKLLCCFKRLPPLPLGRVTEVNLLLGPLSSARKAHASSAAAGPSSLPLPNTSLLLSRPSCEPKCAPSYAQAAAEHLPYGRRGTIGLIYVGCC